MFTQALPPPPSPVTAYSSLTYEELLARPDVLELCDMHSFMRPAGSKTEETFIEKFIVPLGAVTDSYGNHWVFIAENDGSDPHILWSSHTDTVHRDSGLQKLQLGDGKLNAEKSNCLGADDSAGIWLMAQMIRAKIPGVYIFHREEEIGGHGSQHIAKWEQEALTGIKAAIAFDRKGYTSVITHQGGRCCSDAFATSLAGILGGSFEPDPTGLFTDTANYTGIIGECTNISVGYHMAHGPAEYLDIPFVLHLRDVLLNADFSQLVYERKAGEVDEEDMSWFRTHYGPGHGKSSGKGYRDLPTKEELLQYIVDYPDIVAEYLYAMNVDFDELDEYMADAADAAEVKDDDEWGDRGPWN